MSEPTTARKYYVGLDFLKAFAAIFIVLHHYQQYTGTYYEDSFNFFPLMDSQLHVGYLTILYFMISGFFAESQELREDARGQFKSLPGKFWHKCLRIYPVAIVACGRRLAVDDILQHYTERLYMGILEPAVHLRRYGGVRGRCGAAGHPVVSVCGKAAG